MAILHFTLIFFMVLNLLHYKSKKLSQCNGRQYYFAFNGKKNSATHVINLHVQHIAPGSRFVPDIKSICNKCWINE